MSELIEEIAYNFDPMPKFSAPSAFELPSDCMKVGGRFLTTQAGDQSFERIRSLQSAEARRVIESSEYTARLSLHTKLMLRPVFDLTFLSLTTNI